jgi:hypothetical protein
MVCKHDCESAEVQIKRNKKIEIKCFIVQVYLNSLEESFKETPIFHGQVEMLFSIYQKKAKRP